MGRVARTRVRIKRFKPEFWQWLEENHNASLELSKNWWPKLDPPPYVPPGRIRTPWWEVPTPPEHEPRMTLKWFDDSRCER